MMSPADSLRVPLRHARLQIDQSVANGERANEFARFLDMSIKSANETEGHLLSARDLELFTSDEWHKFNSETIEIRKMVYSYRKKVLASIEREK
jgi:four helix bundle protein